MQPHDPPSIRSPQPQFAAGRRALHATACLLVLALLAALLGYQVGKDLAERDNRADCVAAGRVDCR